MKHVAFLCVAIALGGCVGQSEFGTRSQDLPGIPQTIDCDPAPTLVHSKTGDLIEVSYPILHPSCSGGAAEVSRQVSNGFWDRWKFGPATQRIKTLEADSTPYPVAAVRGANATDERTDPGEGTSAGALAPDEQNSSIDNGGTKPAGGTDASDTNPTNDSEPDGNAAEEGSTPEGGTPEPGTDPAVNDEGEEPAATEENEPDDTVETQGDDLEPERETPARSKINELKEHAGLL